VAVIRPIRPVVSVVVEGHERTGGRRLADLSLAHVARRSLTPR
jgi:hypothetical protein